MVCRLLNQLLGVGAKRIPLYLEDLTTLFYYIAFVILLTKKCGKVWNMLIIANLILLRFRPWQHQSPRLL
jgi:hypothetical protein